MSPRDVRLAPEPELRMVTMFAVEARRGRERRKVGQCPTEEVAQQWAATERAAMRGWRVEVVPVTERRWVSGSAEEMPGRSGHGTALRPGQPTTVPTVPKGDKPWRSLRSTLRASSQSS